MNALQDTLTQYVAMRRALGSHSEERVRALGQFVDFLASETAEFVTTDLALRWAMKPADVQRATWARRLSMVRGFAVWLSAIDKRTEIPPQRLLDSRRRRHRPHIYTEQEVKHLMAEAARLPSITGLRPLTYGTLIGLLASTGLRPGEAIGLDTSDVDLVNGILKIRDTKFGKSRFVPVEESTRIALAKYAARCDELCSQRRTAAFLISERGGRLLSGTARRTFARMSRSIGLRAAVGGHRIGNGPRLQDFRHSFTTRRLVAWYRAGMDVQRELPRLATYLGHSDVVHTYWYIEAVPELLLMAAERARAPWGGTQ